MENVSTLVLGLNIQPVIVKQHLNSAFADIPFDGLQAMISDSLRGLVGKDLDNFDPVYCCMVPADIQEFVEDNAAGMTFEHRLLDNNVNEAIYVIQRGIEDAIRDTVYARYGYDVDDAPANVTYTH